MKKIFISLTLLVSVSICFGQQVSKDDESIYATVLGFLKWYKAAQSTDQEPVPSKSTFSIIKDIPVNKSYKRQAIDKTGVEKYLSFYRKSGFLSEDYLNDLRNYFNEINKSLIKRAPIKRNEMIKIDGLGLDIQLQTFEPEIILDNLDKVKLTKSMVIYNKALLGINFASEVNLVFTLSKYRDKWLIDYIGHDNTSAGSFFRQ